MSRDRRREIGALLKIVGGSARLAWRDELIDQMLADVFVLPNTLVAEQVGVVVGEAADHFEETAGDEDLVFSGESHHTLTGVDAVSNGIQVIVDIPHQFHRA
jgi:hypothetical protein